MKIFRYLFSLLALIPTFMSAQVLVKDHIFHPKQFNEGHYDVEPDFVYKKTIWGSESETSHGEFLITDNYLLTGFGGSDNSDFITLLKREKGQRLCQVPMPTQPTAVGLAGDSIYFIDYRGDLYRYLVKPRGIRVTGKNVRLRRGPGTKYEIFADPITKKTLYPLEGDVLDYIGHTDEWNKVRFMGETLYISKQFSEYYEGEAKSHSGLARKQIQIPFEGEESSFIVMTNENQVAVFLQNPSGEMTFITEGNPKDIHIYPEIQTVRYYFSNAIGIEEERIYVTEHGQLNDIWCRTIQPIGNIRKQNEISLETQCTHLVNGKISKCNESGFEAISEVVREVEEYNIIKGL